MSGNGHNQLPNLPATCYTGETLPPVQITGYRCPGPSLYGSGSLRWGFAIFTLWNHFNGSGNPRKAS